jgi:beta-lactamase superfamily II metal-dependent hydrolase
MATACVSPIPVKKFRTTSAIESAPLRTEELFDTNLYHDQLQIRYFHLEADQKSGDSILIKSPEGKTMLIDAGIVETGKSLDRYLDLLEVDSIDYVIATHPHHDHIGGYHTILQSRKIGKLFMPDISHTTEVYSTFSKLIREKEINPVYVKDGDHFKLGNDVAIEIISPSKEALEKAKKEKKLTTRDINNLSLVLKITYKDHSFLFTSDLYKKQETKLINLKKDLLHVDVLDAPHHGDSTSSSQKFINAVSPRYTIISANIIQSNKVLDRYQTSEGEVYVTGMDGNILILSDGETIEVKTERERGYRRY